MGDLAWLILLMAAAHASGDILLYSPYVAESKRMGSFFLRSWYVAKHVLLHVAFLWIWLWPYDVKLKISASIYIFLVHYLIDISRTYYEPIFIDKDDFHIFSRKDISSCLFGNFVNRETRSFLKKHFKVWLGINMMDQSLHCASILIFAFWWF